MAEIAFARALWAVCLLGPAQRNAKLQKKCRLLVNRDYSVTPVFSLKCTPPQTSSRLDQVTGQDARSRVLQRELMMRSQGLCRTGGPGFVFEDRRDN
jgi:hypothetical protein